MLITFLCLVYVDASEACNELGFNLGAQGMGMNTNREWRIRVTQYSCDFPNLAPEGCTKYYFGPDTPDADQVLTTYNFPASHLANQREKFCVRRERNNCLICFLPAATGQFDVSGGKNDLGIVNANGNDFCCGYGKMGVPNVHGYDCIIIPDASKKAMGQPTTLAQYDEFCGGGLMYKESGFFLGTTNAINPGTATGNTALNTILFTICCESDVLKSLYYSRLRLSRLRISRLFG